MSILTLPSGAKNTETHIHMINLQTNVPSSFSKVKVANLEIDMHVF